MTTNDDVAGLIADVVTETGYFGEEAENNTAVQDNVVTVMIEGKLFTITVEEM